MALAACTAFAQPTEPQLHTSVLVASDYIYSGLSQTASSGVLRFAADYEHPTGFFAGGFVANTDFAVETNRPSPRELIYNVYSGYAWRGTDWAGNVSLAQYVYPGASPRYDYSEITAGTSFRNRYFLSYSRSNDYLSLGQETEWYRAGFAYPWLASLEASVNAGEYLTRGGFNSRFSFWDIGLSRVFDRIALDVRYHSNTFRRDSVIGANPDDRWVISLSYSISPRSRRTAR